MKNKYRNLDAVRRIVQIATLVFFAVVPVLILLKVHFLFGTLYSFNVFGFSIIDPSMALQTVVLSLEIPSGMLIALSVPVIVTLIFGRVFCSWVCPYNTLVETGTDIKNKINKGKAEINMKNPAGFKAYIIPAIILILSLISAVSLIPFFSFPGIITSQMSSWIIGLGFGLEIFFIVLILGIEIYRKRFWCKYVCPVGITLSLFKTPLTMKVEYNKDVCICEGEDSPCIVSCPVNLNPKLDKGVYPYCLNCGRCTKACEDNGNTALRFSIGGK